MTPGGPTTARPGKLKLANRAVAVARWCAGASIGLGAAVLAGWVFDVGALKAVHPSLVSMKANTAACFVLAGWALRAQCRPRQLDVTWRRVAQVCAAMVAITGAATLTEYFFGWSLGIDELLFQDSSGVGTSSPGRMSPATAIEFVLVGAALLALDIQTAAGKRPAPWLGLAAFGIALVPGTGYVYGVDEFYSLPGFTSIAVHTVCGLLLLSIAVLLSRPDSALVAPLLDDAEGARVARRLLPAVVVIPLGLGWLRVLGQRAGLYETGFGTALDAVVTVGCLVTLTWWASTRLIRLERGRERVLRDLAASEESLARTVESIGDAVIATDTGGRIDRMNPVAEELTGWRAKDAKGLQLSDVFRILNEHTRSPVQDPVARVIREGKVVELANHTVLIARDGSERPIADSAAPVRDGSGKLMGVVLVFRDQTAERSAEAERQRYHLLEAESRRIHEASRLKAEFLANMSHELRTPLNSVLGFAELLHDGEVGAIAPKQKEFLADILSNGRHLLQLINDVLDLSKVEAGKLEFHPEPIDLGRVVTEAISALRGAAATKRIGIETSIAPEIGHIVIDPVRVKQILLNYLSNAVKFTADGGRVMVRASGDGETALRLEVEDTGVGIAPQDVDRLFVAFRQLDAGTAKKHGGTGLGLALTKHLAEAQGGSVGVRSTPGEGSTFHVVLPRQPVAPALGTSARPAGRGMEKAADSARDPWFPADQQQQLRDCWGAYERHFALLQEATLRRAESHAQFGPILRAMSPDQLAAQQTHSRDLLRKAIAGDWGPYEDHLSHQGAVYARMGLPFSSWYDLVSPFHADLVARLVEAYCSEPARLTGVLVALGAFLDRVMSTVAEQYLGTKREMIREGNTRHGLILETSPDPVISIDDRGTITEFNAGAEKTFGYARSDVLGKPIADVVIPERFRSAQVAGLARYLATGEGPVIGKRVEFTALRADGSEFPAEHSIVVLKLGDGHTQFTGFIRDLTDLKQAEQSRVLWEHVFENAQFGIVISEGDSRKIRSANDAYGKLMGYTPDEIVGRLGTDFVSQEELADVPRLVQRVQERGHETFELTLVRKDGTKFRALVSSSVLPTRPGEPPLRFSTAVDITERKELERARAESAALLERNRRAEEASRLKSEFLANMSHELRTPLNSIIGFAELLHDGEVGAVAPRQKEFLGDILASGKHLLQLINDVLDLSKVEAGKLEFHPEPIALRRVIADVLSILRTPAASRQIRVESAVADDVGEVVLDAARLKQVLYNYLSNALKFTPEGGRVMVRFAADSPSSLRIEVEDTGIGIAPSDMGRLFSEFQQLDSSSSKTHGGTGLGLALTRRLVEAQGGSVGATSELGKGSLFFAVLPRRGEGRPRVDGETHLKSLLRAGAGPAPSSVVLVVDDDAGSLKFMGTVLEQLGFRPSCYSDGRRALDSIDAVRPVAIVLDLLMPGLDGFQFLARLRASPAGATIPVVVWTMKDLSSTELDRLCASASAVVAKGAGAVELTATLRACLGEPAAGDTHAR